MGIPYALLPLYFSLVGGGRPFLWHDPIRSGEPLPDLLIGYTEFRTD